MKMFRSWVRFVPRLANPAGSSIEPIRDVAVCSRFENRQLFRFSQDLRVGFGLTEKRILYGHLASGLNSYKSAEVVCFVNLF